MTNYVLVRFGGDSTDEERLCWWERDALRYAAEESKGSWTVLVSEHGEVWRFINGELERALLIPRA